MAFASRGSGCCTSSSRGLRFIRKGSSQGGTESFHYDRPSRRQDDHDEGDDAYNCCPEGNSEDRSAGYATSRDISSRHTSSRYRTTANLSAHDGSTWRWSYRPVQRRHLLIRGAPPGRVLASWWRRGVLQVMHQVTH